MMPLVDYLDVRVEFATGSRFDSDSIWDVALWDEGIWSGQVTQWTDMTSLVESVTLRYGKQAFLKRSRTGTATVTLDNTHGWFTPDEGVLPGGFLRLRPGRQVRISVKEKIVGAEWEPVWSGFIDTMVNNHLSGNLTATVRCTDAFAKLAVDNTVAQTEQGANELSGARIHRILDHHGWDDELRDVDPGTFPVQATTLAQAALNELQITTDSEGGDFWQAPDGRLTFRERGWRSDVVAWVLGGLAGVPVADIETEWSIQRVVNEAHYASEVDLEQVVIDVASQNTYGRRTHRRFDLINASFTDVLTLAGEVVAALKDDRILITSASVIVQSFATANFVASVKIGDLIQMTVDTMWGWSSTYLVHVVSISHTFNASGWVVTVGLSDTDIVNEYGPYARLEFSEAFHLGGPANA